MLILSLERLGSVIRQHKAAKSISWVHDLIRKNVLVYQLMSEAKIKTSRFSEGYVFPAGTLLIDYDENIPDDIITDTIAGNFIEPKFCRRLKLPKKLSIYNGLNSNEYFFKPYRNLLDAFNLPFTELNDEDIRKGKLDDYDLFIVPGGPDAGESYYAGLGEKGIENIIKFIGNGGNYIGSCAGSYFPLTARLNSPESRMWMNIVKASDPTGLDYCQRGAGFVRINLCDAGHPVMYSIAYGLPSSLDVIYWEGPVFHISDPDVRVLATYQSLLASGMEYPKWKADNQYAMDCIIWPNPISKERFDKHLKDMPAIIEANYGKGRLILFSFHPEFGSPTMNKWDESLAPLFIINSIYDLCSSVKY